MTIKAGFAAAALVSLLASPQGAAGRTLDQVTAAHHLVVGVYRDYDPFSSAEEGQPPHGLDVELGRMIAKRLGVEVQYLQITAGESVSDDLRNFVWKGHYLGYGVCDVMLHVPVDREFSLKNDNTYIFAPYFREQLMVVIDPQQTSSSDLVSAFGDHKVGVEGDTLADSYLMGAFGGQIRNNVTHFHDPDAAVAAMAKGEVAGVMGPRSQVEAAMRAHPGHYKASAMPTPGLMIRSWPIGMAVKVNAHDLANKIEPIIKKMVKDGSFRKLFSKYGLSYIPPTDD